MKKVRLFLAAGYPLLLLGLGLLVWQAVGFASDAGALLRGARERELATSRAMAGFLLAERPELEAELAAVLKDEGALAGYQASGAEALAKYGYGGTGGSERDGYYGAVEESWRVRLLWVPGAYLGGVLLLWLFGHARRSARRGRLLAVLDAYLEEDYSFSQSLDPLFGGRRTGRDGHLSDSLKRLGGLIRWKSRKLLDEQESTKALVTDVSHQLKTPIASLETCFTLYLEADNEVEREEFLARSRLQIEKLEELCGALIGISRMETAMIELKPTPTDLREMLVRAVNGVYDKARRKGIELELAPFDDASLNLDEHWTAEAVMNVLDNAVKYSPPDTAIRISVEQRTSFTRVEIADQGIGVPKEVRPRVFQRFYRGDHPLVRASEGSGVGLYLTRMILEKQGGSISVKSGAGQGSVFVLQLPRL